MEGGEGEEGEGEGEGVVPARANEVSDGASEEEGREGRGRGKGGQKGGKGGRREKRTYWKCPLSMRIKAG